MKYCCLPLKVIFFQCLALYGKNYFVLKTYLNEEILTYDPISFLEFQITCANFFLHNVKFHRSFYKVISYPDQFVIKIR